MATPIDKVPFASTHSAARCVTRLMSALLLLSYISAPAAAEKFIVYTGSYTDAPSTSKGIYAARFDSENASLTSIGAVADVVNPAYLSGTPDGRFLYAVNWQTAAVAQGKSDTVSAFAIDQASGSLRALNTVSAGGALPNQAVVDPTGKVLLVANYGAHVATEHNAGISAMGIERDGTLSAPFYIDLHPNEAISTRGGNNHGPHTHGIAFSKDEHYVFVADLGLDRIYTYRFNAAGKSMSQSTPAFVHVPPDSGPRRLVVSQDGKFLYCNYQDSSKVGVFGIDDGKLTELQSITTLPEGFSGRNSTAEIAIDKAGRFLYVSNRGADTIAAFSINKTDGTLRKLEDIAALGQSPRNMTFDPTGRYLIVANQMSNNVVFFRFDPETGHLSPSGLTLDVPQAAGVFLVHVR
jgi:6-phosphogluconolactonase